ncbi:hypothetical protein DPMN_176850 [Dreissena polymorpha]|uniref:Uncharacterized protein n=1 Tax=Dreissena polymorpha TaxID=45954 RepID=A0A9D4E962_DREPO|nr:hypothetical protein DPMN_176850 [Dreissena polymorpha]
MDEKNVQQLTAVANTSVVAIHLGDKENDTPKKSKPSTSGLSKQNVSILRPEGAIINEDITTDFETCCVCNMFLPADIDKFPYIGDMGKV